MSLTESLKLNLGELVSRIETLCDRKASADCGVAERRKIEAELQPLAMAVQIKSRSGE